MLSWVGRLMISRNVEALRDGDFEGKQPLREWLERFVSWARRSNRTRSCSRASPGARRSARGTIHLDTPEDGRVYDNRYVIWGRISRGKLREYEVYEDTQRSRAFDEYLEKRDQPAHDQ
jgi:ketosteroid isomerase-like protein